MNRIILSRNLLGRTSLHYRALLSTPRTISATSIQLKQPTLSYHARRYNSTDETSENVETTGTDAVKVIFTGIFGIVVLWSLITLASQLPADPERMTQEKQLQMSEDELKAYEKSMLEKGYLQLIGDQFPSWWRWKEAALGCWDKATVENWFGFKLATDYFTSSTEPEWKIALPPPLKDPYPQTKYTITIEVLGTLFVTHFDPINGWCFKPRPGAGYLMSKIGFPNTELVFYTEASPQDVQPFIQKYMERLNKKHPGEQAPGPLYQLFRNSCHYEEGNYKKNLAILGRDQRFVMHIDVNDYSYRDQDARNVILVKRQEDLAEGEKDMCLYDLADFLEKIINDRSVADVRETMDEFRKKEDGSPVTFMTEAFREREMAEALDRLEEQKLMRELEEQTGHKVQKKKFGRFL